MTIVTYEQDLPVPFEETWAVLADFAGFLSWAGGPGATLEIVGDEGIGMVRRMNIPGIGLVGERLVRLDEAEHVLSYEIAEGNPLGMDTYIAVATLSDKGDGTCHIAWHGTMTAVDGADEAQVAEALKGSYVGMSGSLAAYVGG